MKGNDEVFEYLGYVFCEFSFRWYSAFNGLLDVPFYRQEWRWYNHVSSFIGSSAYSIGRWFYNLGGPDESR